MVRIEKKISILNAVIEAMFSPSETVKYPFETLELPEGYRGAILFEPEKCIGCGLCVRDCPAEALKLNKKSREEFTLLHYPARCAYCGQCEDSCRHGAIYHSNKLVGSNANKEERVVVLKEKRP